jgi:hypothetical protein
MIFPEKIFGNSATTRAFLGFAIAQISQGNKCVLILSKLLFKQSNGLNLDYTKIN